MTGSNTTLISTSFGSNVVVGGAAIDIPKQSLFTVVYGGDLQASQPGKKRNFQEFSAYHNLF